jgi:oxygen-independent coproporphyrinogen-3 oxidase
VLSLYLHIPFCQRKCPYCDFNTYAGLSRLFSPYTSALAREIELAGAARGRPVVATMFLGGGTPTVLPVDRLEEILGACRRAFDVRQDAEITSEANPGTVDADKFAALRELGVNRLSMGVQSFDDSELQFLGRIHTAREVDQAFDLARRASFDNINLDLIYGLPGQSPDTWRRSLRRAVDLGPEHLSIYSLTIEEDTPFAEWAREGRIGAPDSDLAADLYELAEDVLASAGYAQYEISNWAREVTSPSPGDAARAARESQHVEHARVSDLGATPDRLGSSENPQAACRHNLVYWRNESYLGFGPGAHSSELGWRWANVKSVPGYIDRLGQAASAATAPPDGRTGGWTDFAEPIGERTAIGETMMLGLRLVREGVPYERFFERHRQPLLAFFDGEIRRLSALGQLEVLRDRVRLTPRARLVGNQVFAEFLE